MFHCCKHFNFYHLVYTNPDGIPDDWLPMLIVPNFAKKESGSILHGSSVRQEPCMGLVARSGDFFVGVLYISGGSLPRQESPA